MARRPATDRLTQAARRDVAVFAALADLDPAELKEALLPLLAEDWRETARAAASVEPGRPALL